MTIKAKIDIGKITDEALEKLLKQTTSYIQPGDTITITLPSIEIKNYFTETIEITFVDERRAKP